MKKALSFLLPLLLIQFSVAAPVGLRQAQRQAGQFLTGSEKAVLTCVYPAGLISKGDGQAPLYVFSGNEKGFVIISGESDVASVIGYSTENVFPQEEIPANLQQYLTWFENRITAYQSAVAAGTLISAAPGSPAKRFTKAEDAVEVVPPLLVNHPDGSISYNQRWPYNALCPNPDSLEYNVVTGCVATALAQIARFYEYPVRGLDTVTYTHAGYTYTADLTQSYYDWDNMLTSYNNGWEEEYTEEQINAVALLHRDIGYAVNMMYGYNGSGAYDHIAMMGMVQHLGFSPAVRYEPHSFYSDEQWRDLLASSLDEGQPLYHSGYGDGAGHAFVCDGYNSEDYFHFNWGWAGFGDGWYLLDDLAPTDLGTGAGNGVYNEGRVVLYNMRPPKEGDDYLLEFRYDKREDERVFKCRRGIFSASDTLNCSAFNFYNYTSSSFYAEFGIGFWQEERCVKALSVFDSVYFMPFYGWDRADFRVCPGRELPEGTYKMSLAVRYGGRETWDEVIAPQGTVYAYKVVLRNDSVLVFDLDETGDFPEEEFPEVINLKVKVIDDNAYLFWEVDSTLKARPERFRLYADEKYLGVTRFTEYELTKLSDGMHQARIIALYPGNGESSGVTVSFEVNNQTANAATQKALHRIYPNPFGGELKVETSCAGVLKLIGADGKTVCGLKIPQGGLYTLPAAQTAPGVYVLRFETLNGSIITEKVVKK